DSALVLDFCLRFIMMTRYEKEMKCLRRFPEVETDEYSDIDNEDNVYGVLEENFSIMKALANIIRIRQRKVILKMK
ncbi:hypothetical protein CEXT_401631, partial [Caerostris extrusa]